MRFNRSLLLEASKKIAISKACVKRRARRTVDGGLGAHFPQPDKSGMIVRLDRLQGVLFWRVEAIPKLRAAALFQMVSFPRQLPADQMARRLVTLPGVATEQPPVRAP